MKAIRKLYEQFGAEKYYKEYGQQYQNPHLEQIQKLIQKNQSQLDYNKVLDLCAGGGEVSLMLQKLGFRQITAADPFTQALYQKKTGIKCYNWSFDSIIKGKITGQYSSIICSFAMHLCPEEKLYPLVIQLFTHSKSLAIISPHKRPKLENLTGVILDFEDFVLTEKGKKVFLKHYTYSHILK